MLSFHVYDVFTETAYAGNPLAIVEGAEGLTGEAMQKMAAEFNLSETIFILPPQDPAHTAAVRIFTPNHEMPFAGHPTIGCAIHLALGAAGDGGFETVITLEEQLGLVPVQVMRGQGRIAAEFTSPADPVARPLQADADQIAAALGLAAGDIGPHKPHVVEGGHPFCYLPVMDRAALSRAKPTEPAFSALAQMSGAGSVYVYAPGGGFDYEARMFAPIAGIAEDPATGSATALLAAQLLANGAIGEGTNRLALCQGRDMGRESHLALTIDVAGGALGPVRVGGSAVRVSSGQITPA